MGVGAILVGTVAAGAAVLGAKKLFSGNSSTARRIANSDAYDEENASAQQIINLNNQLNDWKGDIAEKSKEIEVEIYKGCLEIITRFKNNVDELNKTKFGNKKLNISTKKLEYTIESLSEQIEGTLKKYLLDKVSLSNEECKNILSMDKVKDKENSMKNFLDENLSKALDKLNINVKKIISKEFEDIKENIDYKLETLKDANREKLDSLKSRFQNTSSEEEIELEKEQINFKIEINNFILSNL